ncbi:MAG TPA: glycoside hydrolase family 3 N-terminal domain-containing protein [Streptosporangiaceae bacterium]
MSAPAAADPSLARLADAILIPPFPGTRAPAWVLAALGEGLAGVTLFGPNISGTGQLAALAGRLRAAGTEPVIAIDEEGGDVTRIAHRKGSSYPGNAALGAVDDVTLTEAVYRALGADLAALGINVDLAPSADVNTAADNPVIGTRSFGSDTALVARHAAAAVRGLQAAGVAACAKHFPGHGSTRSDTHHAVALVEGTLADVIRRDLPPFEAAIAAGVRAVMPGHLRVPELTGDLPASLSAAALTGLLRGDLGFTGVIVSDALEMRAVSRPAGIPEAAVLAVAAGTDVLCFGRDQDELTYLAVRDALVTAVADGRLPGRRLEEAAARVAELRAWTAARPVPVSPVPVSPVPVSPVPAGPIPAARVRSGRVPAGRIPAGPVSAGKAPAGPISAGKAPAGPAPAGPVPAGTSPSGPAPDGEAGPAPEGQAGPAPEGQAGPAPEGEAAPAPRGEVGLIAARRAVRVEGAVRPAANPLVVEIVPPANIAVGTVPWGLGSWVPRGSVRRVSTAAARQAAPSVLTAAAGRPLIIVVRDAHRYRAARDLVTALLRARPDAVVVEMGLPAWRPPAAAYIATYGAARTSGRAAAEVLGLARR